jgi:hypothetical protein
MICKNFNIKWHSLAPEMQDEILESVKPLLLEKYQFEGEEALKKEWNDPKPMTWKEAYVRVMAIDHDVWRSYEINGNTNGVGLQSPDWNGIFEEHLENEALKVCSKQVQLVLEIKV